jgi:nucleoside-diphosphate-sugar epimerase
MTAERFLITGALGCVGAWTAKHLTDEGLDVWTYDLGGDAHRLRLTMDDDALAKVHLIEGDIADLDTFERTVGAKVNVVGTTVVLETAKRRADQLQGLAYASSIGVYGEAENYPDAPLAHDAPLDPPTLYGVFKQANEGTARIYWREYGVDSIGLRPYVVYGPGRDQGWSSTPTKAMLAAILGRPFHISYGGTVVYHHAAETARVMIRAARTSMEGAHVYNLGGATASMQEIVAAIEDAVPEIAGQITFDPTPLPHPPTIDDSALTQALGPIDWLSMHDGVQQTIDYFRTAIDRKRLDIERALQV